MLPAPIPVRPRASIASIKEKIGPQVAHLSDAAVIEVYRYAEAVAGLKMELIFFEAGIVGRTRH